MSETNSRTFGHRYRAVEPADPPQKASSLENSKPANPQEAVLDFVIYLYDRIRDDATMVARLDRVLKERYDAFS